MLTVRMNWMDVDKSQSADVQLSKDSKDIPVYHRNKLFNHRAQVASMIRYQLAIIQKELNGDEDNQTEEAKAAEAITALIKGQRYRDGKLYTCYLDGTSHEGCEMVTAYNQFCRQRLDSLLQSNKDITALVPSASEFDTAKIERMLDEEATLTARCADGGAVVGQRAELQKKIDAERKAYNDKAAKCSRYLNSFVAIRNAKLSEGFDPSLAGTGSAPNHSFAGEKEGEEDIEHQHEEEVPTEEVLDAAMAEDAEVQQETEEEPLTTDAQNESAGEAVSPQDEAEEQNSAILEENTDEPTLRDATIALNSTVAPHE